MPTRIAINGFGRIGRLCLRAMLQRQKGQLSVVAVNDMAELETNAHLFQYDSTYGTFAGKLEVGEGMLVVDGWTITVLNEKDPSRLPWKKLGVDIVIESTGVFTDGLQVKSHLEAGARKVIITAPARNEDITLVLGVNDAQYDPKKHRIVSNASCTTNCLAPVVKVLHESFGVERGLMTTTHAYTNDQRILDLMHTDLRRARAAALNIVPTSTGAAKAIGLVMPELRGKLHGMALRVPVPTVSVVDLVADLKHAATAETINEALKKAAEGHLKGILAYCDKPLVSSDFRGHPASAIIDAISTVVLEGKMAKVIAWYDNEWGYSCRVADLAAFMAKKG
ncbi:MAG: type I glyceraldehyde-3-phosphate dehydrogenase [Deltaproteobacteria bacterium GWA2_57_13]|nr:MAG: type I glyceraldehyde-3-phosphate dehydrogenase [Deltaproteobacteria bacterium GWA2_57_13]OGQ84388.1 MAG: type I glyceraldehyde-3-phosphate dehydrogenase [Deltaproteobacteria bacterium RIFCSPLOWO2_12_FULL_57_22]